MSESDSDLQQFTAMLPMLLAEHVNADLQLDDAQSLPRLRRALDNADVADLALETANLGDALRWLAATVTAVAHISPALGFVLAARYTAQRSVAASAPDLADATEVTAGVVQLSEAGATATAPRLFEPALVLALDPASGRAALHRPSAEDASPEPARTGLSGAKVGQVPLAEKAVVQLSPGAAATAFHDWTVLISAVALGLTTQARDVSEQYAAERHQFGSALLSFPAMRAMLAEMHQRVATVHALLDQAVDSDPASAHGAEAWAAAGRAAVETAVDAIQVHGGYGYIDEYPAADLLRDAVSIRARGGSRRGALAAIAGSRLGVPS